MTGVMKYKRWPRSRNLHLNKDWDLLLSPGYISVIQRLESSICKLTTLTEADLCRHIVLNIVQCICDRGQAETD